jgi:RNA polymerase sigma factor (sigma-70 family)
LEAGSFTTTRVGLLGGRSPLLRLQSDERLIALLRAGNDAAFDVLFGRYRSRLNAFCRHMLGSKEDAEDVLQDVFAAAYNAILADQREINVRPWLYRIARNRCLNHLRRPVPDGRDTMDDQIYGNGTTTADVVHKRADLRHLLADVQKLPESQRTALLLREIDALSYDQIAHAMETTIPSVKSLLVRARMSLAEAAEARQLTCDEVREELARVAEGLKKTTPPIKRHLRECEDCSRYRKHLRSSSAAMAMVFPVAPLLALKKLLLAKAGFAAFGGAGGGGATGATVGGVAGTSAAAGGAAAGGAAAGGAVAGGAAAGGLAVGGAGAALPVGVGAVTSKAIAGIAVTAILAGGAVEAKKVAMHAPAKPSPPPAAAPAQPPAPAAEPTGGAALSDVPGSLVQKAKPLDDAKPADDAAAAGGATGAEGAGTTHSGGVAGPSGASDSAPGVKAGQEKELPATGSTTAPETGGAAPPPTGAPAPAPVSGSGGPAAAPPAGTTGP